MLVQIFPEALNAEEIQALYEDGPPKDGPIWLRPSRTLSYGRVAHWSLPTGRMVDPDQPYIVDHPLNRGLSA